MSPLVWDLAHVGQQEELWLLRAGDPTRPRMRAPAVDALYDAFKHPSADRASLPLLPTAEARAYDHEVGGRLLDLIEHTPADELFTAGMVVQHDEQHDETMLATLELRQRPPMMLGRRPLPPGRAVEPDCAFVGGGPFTLGVDTASEPFSLDNERPAHTVDVGPVWIGRSRSVTGSGASSSAAAGTSGRSCGPPAAGRTGPRPAWSGRCSSCAPASSRASPMTTTRTGPTSPTITSSTWPTAW
jgi:DinB superfamily